MQHENYNSLTMQEQNELANRIANGDISRSCKRAKIDWINIQLSTGKRAVGSYRWESGNGEFLRLEIK
jgi:hypothetical protein